MTKIGDPTELDWMRDRYADRVFIVGLYPYKISQKAVSEIWLSTEVWDDGSQRNYLPILKGSITVGQSLPGELLGASTQNGGSIEIDNSDGLLDDWLTTYSWGARTIEIFGIDPNDEARIATFDFPIIFFGNILSVSFSSDNTVVIEYTPELGATNVDVFGATLTDNERRWPIVYGRVYNVAGKPYTDDTVDDSDRIYKISRYQVNAIDGVYVSGVAQSLDANYADLSALVTAQGSLIAGEYATCIAEGLFAVHGSADGTVTCDIKGRDGTTGGYKDTAGEIIEDIATESEITGETKFPSWTLSGLTFNEFKTEASQEIGFYIDSAENVLDLVARIVASVGGVFWWDNLGRMAASVFKNGVSSESIGDITELEDIIGDIQVRPWNPPIYRYILQYNRNYTVQQGDGLPSVIDYPFGREFLFEEWREAVASDNTPESIHADAAQILNPTMIQKQPEAFSEAARRLNLFKTQRFVYTVRAWNRIGGYGLMDTWTLFHDRFAPNGKPLKVISAVDNLEERYTDLELWG